MGRASLDISLTLIRIIISCTHTTLKTQILNSITLLIVFGLCLHLLSSHHFSVLLAGEVKSRQDGLELVENLVVSRHVSGQDASACMNYDRIKTL